MTITGVGQGAELIVRTSKDGSVGILIDKNRDLYINNCSVDVRSDEYYGVAGNYDENNTGIIISNGEPWRPGARVALLPISDSTSL